ncbi:Transposon Ty3-G Gag-Pol polyprotein [Trichinella spiralis]|uniref:Transposon Ty3-G Gag-Pol polyprotein n=1 Tax=Trichinella spiralis TaxID=6334 RepID=A0A0V1B3Q9_TRISP|nr:Transposon Ty3-G Gag-Pol polyprotein [Trichinella spiralis]
MPVTAHPEILPRNGSCRMEEFFVVTGFPSSHQAASARLSVNGAVRRELFPPVAPQDISSLSGNVRTRSAKFSNQLYTAELRHVSDSLTKYYYVIASLPDSVAPDVNDLLEPAGDAPYETLKRRLPERYAVERRLPPDRLELSRKEFDNLLDLSIIRPSSSSWAYPISNINDFVTQLGGRTIFSKVDLIRAYQQIPVAEVDTPKTAIMTPFGLFEYRFMDEVTRGLRFCFVYLDDVLVASRSKEEYEKYLATLFQRFEKKNRSDTQIPSADDHARTPPIPPMLTSLHDLQKNLKLPEDAVNAFDEVKEALANATLLSHPQEGAAFSLVVDASGHAAGAALQQRHKGRWSSLAFFSRRFQPREMRYSAFGRELLTIYLAIRHFRYWLEGQQFTVLTDHKPIVQAVQRGTGSHNPREFVAIAPSQAGRNQYSPVVRHRTKQDSSLRAAAFTPQSFLHTPRSAPSQHPRLATTGETELHVSITSMWTSSAHYHRRADFPPAYGNRLLHPLAGAWVAGFGILTIVTTDQGRQFQSALWREITIAFGIKLAPASAYHPQTNGMVERFHRHLKTALAAHAYHSHRWIEALPLVLLGIRSSVKEDLRHAPAELRPPTDPLRLHSTDTVKSRRVAEIFLADRVEELHARLRAEHRSTTTPIADVRRTVLGAELRRVKPAFLDSGDAPHVRNMQLSPPRSSSQKRRRVTFARPIEVIS